MTVNICRIEATECRLLIYHDPNQLLALDVPLDLGTNAAQLSVPLRASESSFVEVLCDGDGVEGASVAYVAGDSGVRYFDAPTDRNGTSFTFRLPERHAAVCRVELEGHWSRQEVVPLRPGRNVVLLDRLGTLHVDRGVDPSAVTWEVTGASLQDWIDVGRLSESPGEWTVPIGVYRWLGSDGEPIERSAR